MTLFMNHDEIKPGGNKPDWDQPTWSKISITWSPSLRIVGLAARLKLPKLQLLNDNNFNAFPERCLCTRLLL